MSFAASKGRDGIVGSGTDNPRAGVRASGPSGLAGQSANAWKPEQDFKAEDSIPNKELMREVGDVDKVTPRDPVGAAKQNMEQERGQRFTSATGEGLTHRPGGNPLN